MFNFLTAIFIIYIYAILNSSNKSLIFNFDNITEKIITKIGLMES